MKIFNYIIDAKLNARHAWSHFKVHKYDMYRHLVWGRLSVIYGQPHLELVPICAHCGSEDIGEVGYGDEGWTVCQDCQTVEGGYKYITVEEYEKR